MPTLHRDFSTRRSSIYREEQDIEAPSRAMDHYYRFQDRKRPPSYLVQEDYVPQPPSEYADYEYPERRRPSYHVPDNRQAEPDTPQKPARQTTLQSDEKSPSYGFAPETPTKASTGPLEIEIPPMSAQTASTVNSFFVQYFTAILSISTLGASITFNYILNGNFRNPDVDSRYSKSDLQTFIAMAWLLFILGLAFTAAFQTLLKFYGKQLQQAWDIGGRRQRLAQWVGMSVSFLLLALIIGAFIFLSLVVTAYTPGVGWTAVTFTTIFGIFGFASIIYQAPIWSHQRR